MLDDLAEAVEYAGVSFAGCDFPVLQLYSCLHNIERVPFYTLSTIICPRMRWLLTSPISIIRSAESVNIHMV
jgi:hypothetical protein